MGQLKGQQIGFYVWVTSAYKLVAAMTERSIERSADEIDTTSTSTGGYTSSMQGRKDATLSIAGIAEFAPAATEISYTELLGLYDNGTEFTFKIAEVGGGTAYPAKYGTGWLNAFNESFNDGESVQWDGSVRVVGAMVAVDPNAAP